MEQLQNNVEQEALAKSAMTTSIVGLVLSELGIPGWIVSAIARKKVKAATEAGVAGGKLKTANILSKIGLPVSIVMTIFWVIYVIIMVVAAGMMNSMR